MSLLQMFACEACGATASAETGLSGTPRDPEDWLVIDGPSTMDELTRTRDPPRPHNSHHRGNNALRPNRPEPARHPTESVDRGLDSLSIIQKNSRPNHPTTCGKVERFHQTLKRWLAARPAPATIDELQTVLDAFVDEYNQRRPHRSLHGRTPTAAYQARPKATPSGVHQPHYRIRRDKVSHGNVSLRLHGELHHIGLGRHLHGTPIIMLIDDLDVRVIHATTGEIITTRTLDPNRRYHGSGRPIGGPRRPYGPRKTTTPEP